MRSPASGSEAEQRGCQLRWQPATYFLWPEHGNGFAKPERMTFLIVAAVLFCVLSMFLVTHLSVDVVQALLAVAIMTIAWHLLSRRPGRSMSDDFGPW